MQGEAKGKFPYFIPKTDEPRLQNLMDYFETMKNFPFECTDDVKPVYTVFNEKVLGNAVSAVIEMAPRGTVMVLK